jgi:hydroxyacylglutathione hydrolase
VVDPGQGSLPWVTALLRREGLRAEAVLLTHGHMDHTWDAQPLADELEIPVLLAAAGHAYLEAPESALPTSFPPELLVRHPRRRPARLVAPEPEFTVGDMRIRTLHTPGHTPCSVTYLIDVAQVRLVCTGDTVLGGAHSGAGQDGTPVPPGGDGRRLRTSLGTVRAHLAGTTVLPGHGPAFSMPAVPEYSRLPAL